MISLKVEHNRHLPCHPTRSFIEENRNSIFQTDRQHISQSSDDNNQYTSNQTPFQDFRTIGNQTAFSQSDTGSRMSRVIGLKHKKSSAMVQEVYQTNIIQKNYQKAVQEVPENLRDLIKQKQKLIQDKVYLSLNDKGNQVLERMYKEIDTEGHYKDQVKENLLDMMSKIQGRIQGDIGANSFLIHSIIRANKQDILKPKKERKSEKLKEEIILRKNDTQLKEKNSNRESIDNESQQGPPSVQDYSLKSHQTKKAQLFIKKISQQKAVSERKKKQRQEKKKSFEVRSMQEKRQFEKEIKEEKKNYLKRKYQAKREVKEKQLQIREKMHRQYKDFLAKYKKSNPLFKRKEKQYEKECLEQEQRIQKNILEKIKQHRRPISFNEIKDHEKKYLELKLQTEKEKSEAKKIETSRASVQYQKSKFHEILEEEETKEKERQAKQDPKLIRSELIKKRDLYSKEVRQKFLPKIDDSKQKQLDELMEKLKWAQKLKSGKTDDLMYRAQGLKNLRRVHELIEELRKEGKLAKKSQTIDYPSAKPVYRDYLQQLREITKNTRYSIDYDKMADQSLKGTHLKAKQYEQRAKKRELYVNGGKLTIDQTLKEKRQIDDEYLSSMKAKMALLNKLNG